MTCGRSGRCSRLVCKVRDPEALKKKLEGWLGQVEKFIDENASEAFAAEQDRERVEAVEEPLAARDAAGEELANEQAENNALRKALEAKNIQLREAWDNNAELRGALVDARGSLAALVNGLSKWG